MEFRRITSLPPYVFTIIDSLKVVGVLGHAGRHGDEPAGLQLGGEGVAHPQELVARIRAVSRRWRPSTADPTETAVGALKIDHRSHVATLDGTEIRLTPKEFDLLAFLATKAGTMVDRTELLNEARRWCACAPEG